MSKKMCPVVHFEMPYEDKSRAIDFYEKVFGWRSQMLGPEMGNYVVVSTSETDEKTHMPKEPGKIGGGLFEKTENNKSTSVVIAVEDIQAAMKNVADTGGEVLGGMNPGEPDDIPGVGLYCAIKDSEGNLVGILQPKGM